MNWDDACENVKETVDNIDVDRMSGDHEKSQVMRWLGRGTEYAAVNWDDTRKNVKETANSRRILK